MRALFVFQNLCPSIIVCVCVTMLVCARACAASRPARTVRTGTARQQRAMVEQALPASSPVAADTRMHTHLWQAHR